MTHGEFTARYAAKHGVTPTWLKRRDVWARVCRCGHPDCLGYFMYRQGWEHRGGAQVMTTTILDDSHPQPVFFKSSDLSRLAGSLEKPPAGEPSSPSAADPRF